jgi:hypothetical protein
MNKSSKSIEQQVSGFLDYHGIAVREDMPHRGAIRLALALHDAFANCVNDHRSIWDDRGHSYYSLIEVLIDRVYEKTTGVILCYLTGAWATLESETRSTMESSVTAMFVCGDPILRLGQYLTSYFATAEGQLNQHLSLVRGTAEQEHVIAARGILRSRRDFVDGFCKEYNIPFPAIGWPDKLIDRFSAVDESAQYRHLYAVLSSEAHGDAGSLIDLMFYRVYTAMMPDVEPVASAEIANHIQQFMYSAIAWYAKSLAAFASRFGVDAELATPINEAFEEIGGSLVGLREQIGALRKRAAEIGAKL